MSNESIEVVSLERSLESLKDHFNRHEGQLRFLALLSPT